MLKQAAVYEEIEKKVRTKVSEDIYGCDHCEVTIDMNDRDSRVLGLDVFTHTGGDTEKLIFCSWPCVLQHLPTIECDYFISLPFVSFDEKGKCGAKEFLKLIETIKY